MDSEGDDRERRVPRQGIHRRTFLGVSISGMPALALVRGVAEGEEVASGSAVTGRRVRELPITPDKLLA